MTRSYLQRLAGRVATASAPLPRVVPDTPRSAVPAADEPFEAVAPLDPPVIPSAKPSNPAPVTQPRETPRGRTVVVPPVRTAPIERVVERVTAPAASPRPAAPALEIPVATQSPRAPFVVAPESPVASRRTSEPPKVEPSRPQGASAPRESSPPPRMPAPPAPAAPVPDAPAPDLWAELERRSSQLRAPTVEKRVERIERVLAPAAPVVAPPAMPPPAAQPHAAPIAAAPRLTIGRIRVEVVAPQPAPRAPATVSRVVIAAPRSTATPQLLLSGVFGLGQS